MTTCCAGCSSRWDEIDAQAGFAIDHRAVCAFLARDDQVLGRLERIAALPDGQDPQTRAQLVLLSLVWTRACARRPDTLRASNRFVARPPATERTLLRDVLPGRPAAIDVDAGDWRGDLAAALRTWGAARLLSTSGRTSALARAVADLMVEPLEVDWLQAYPQLEGITREDGQYSVSMSLREAPQ